MTQYTGRPAKKISLTALLLAVTFAGCSSDLSRSKANALIEQQKDFRTTIELGIPIGNFWWDYRNLGIDPHYPLLALRDQGILTLRESGQKNSLWGREYITELTPRGKDLSKLWVSTKDAMPSGTYGMDDRCWTTWGHGEPCHKASGVVYSVILAQKHIEEVTGITTEAGGKEASAEFTWRWVATDAGKSFMDHVPSNETKGEAEFELYDDGWRIARIKLDKDSFF
jgi:hypothetical protein